MKHVPISARETAKQDTAIVPFAIALAVIVALVAAVRLPFLSNLLLGEEGSHAYLVVGALPVIKGLDAIFIGRLNGVDYLVFPEHNMLMYDFVDTIGRGIGRLVPLCRDDSIACTSTLSRTPFLIMFLIAVVIAFLPLRRWLAVGQPAILAIQALIVLFMLTSPLMVGGSIQPQIDGSVGVMVAAVSAATIISAATLTGRARFLLWSLGGVASSLGKSEWALALAAALLVTSAIALAASYDKSRHELNWVNARPAVEVCGSILAGILLGQTLVLLRSPTAYLAGFALMREINAMQLSVVAGLRQSWPLAYPVFALACAALLLMALRLRNLCRSRPEIVAITGWACAIAAGYVHSGWSGDGFPRYYCLAAVLLVVGLVCLLRDVALPRIYSAFVVVLLLAGVGRNAASLIGAYRTGSSISSLPGTPLEKAEANYLELARAYRGVPVLEWSAFGIYFRNIDWVAVDMGRQAGIELVQEHRPEVLAEYEASIR